MNKKKTVLIILSIILLTSLLFASSRVKKSKRQPIQGILFEYKNEKFSFDFMPVNEFTYGEVAKLPYQLPDSLLSSLSTEELIWFCADHPFFALQDFITKSDILENFNGFRELISRDNLLDELYNLVENIKYNKQKIDKKPKLEREKMLKKRYALQKESRIISKFFNSTVLFKHLNKNQRIRYFEFMKTVAKRDKVFSGLLFFPIFRKYYPEDSHIVESCFSGGPFSNTASVGGNFAPLIIHKQRFIDYLNKKIKELK